MLETSLLIGKDSKNGMTNKGLHYQECMDLRAEGAAAIVKGAVIEEPETIATAIRIGNPASWKLAEAARDESKGFIDAVTDEEILNAYRKVAAQDGVFIEPGSAASLAGVIQHVKNGKIRPGETVVAVFTGNGLKDPDTAIQATEVAIHKMSDLEEMRQHLRKRSVSTMKIRVPATSANLGPGFDSLRDCSLKISIH